MGLIRSVDDIQKTLQNTQKQKQQIEAEKKKQQIEKANLEALEKEILTGLKIDFENLIKKMGFDSAMLYISNVRTKKAFISLYLQNHDQLNFKNKKYVETIINNNYFKILKQLEAEYKKHTEYIRLKNKKELLYIKNLELRRKILEKQQATRKINEEYQRKQKELKHKKTNKIINILIFTFICIIFAPFALVAIAVNAMNKK